MIRAVVDVGSNSILLVVAEDSSGQWRVLFESSRVTGLGRGTAQTGLLSDQGIRDTLAALEEAFETANAHDAGEIVAAATMAARIATNTDVFLNLSAAQGTPVRVLSGEEEADLGLLAVVDDPLLWRAGTPGTVSIIDPGGHSTELVTASRNDRGEWAASFRKSFPIGTLALRGGILSAESPTPGERLAAAKAIDEAIDLEYGPGEAGRAVVLGATGTNLVTIRAGMAEWDPDLVHGQVLLYEEIGRSVGWLFDMDDAGRRALVGLEPGRETTIAIGALILERFLHAIKAAECTVSVRGWRHALLERGWHALAIG
ncbi:MAG TPA: hypothetical protein PLL78_11480 [Fimbriimonadaceae bacterium]|nr:hypothetical protein [Fimbriimonadaceae bacterium]HRJ97297.1 hypothetical protein [Fimbriimonadaceae bacterium]